MGVMGDERDGVFVESFLYRGDFAHLICPAFGRHCAVHVLGIPNFPVAIAQCIVLGMPSFRSPLRSAFTLAIQQSVHHS